MDEMTYTLQELAELSGIEARTIRSYIERDLLPGPYGLGPKAAYGQEHVDRLKVLGLLRNAHRAITLDQIRTLLGQLTPEQIAAIADGRQKVSTAFGGGLPVSSALTYLKSITVRGDRRDRSERGPSGYRSEPSEPAASAASAEPAEPASPSPLPGPSAPNLRPLRDLGFAEGGVRADGSPSPVRRTSSPHPSTPADPPGVRNSGARRSWGGRRSSSCSKRSTACSRARTFRGRCAARPGTAFRSLPTSSSPCVASSTPISWRSCSASATTCVISS